MGKNQIIEGLQQIITGLSTQADAHEMVSKVFTDKGYLSLGQKYEQHAQEERDFLSQMIQRILDLGGDVQLQDRKGMTIYSDPLQWIQQDLKVSQGALSKLHEMVELTRSDYKTFKILEAYYMDEEEDMVWSEAQLELIEKIGYENWLVQNL